MFIARNKLTGTTLYVAVSVRHHAEKGCKLEMDIMVVNFLSDISNRCRLHSNWYNESSSLKWR